VSQGDEGHLDYLFVVFDRTIKRGLCTSSLTMHQKPWKYAHSSSLDDPTLWPAVYPTLAFKSYRDAPKYLLQHRMNRHFIVNLAVHPTPLFGLHSTAPSGCSLAPDGPTGRRCIASVHWLGHMVQRLYWLLWVTGWSDACVGGTIGSSDSTTFSEKLFLANLPC
jgi:hypothetical protein